MQGDVCVLPLNQPPATYICSALAAVGRRICTTLIHPEGLSAFVACRLIPLDKCPGMRPIGVGEVPRRILAKAVLRIVGRDVEEAAGPLQVCAGQDGGCEPAVHAMRRIFHHPDTEGVLLVDATNAFNTINRQAALQNISIICPSIAQILILQNTGQDGNCRKRRNRLNGGHNTGRSIGDGHACMPWQ